MKLVWEHLLPTETSPRHRTRRQLLFVFTDIWRRLHMNVDVRREAALVSVSEAEFNAVTVKAADVRDRSRRRRE